MSRSRKKSGGLHEGLHPVDGHPRDVSEDEVVREPERHAKDEQHAPDQGHRVASGADEVGERLSLAVHHELDEERIENGDRRRLHERRDSPQHNPENHEGDGRLPLGDPERPERLAHPERGRLPGEAPGHEDGETCHQQDLEHRRDESGHEEPRMSTSATTP